MFIRKLLLGLAAAALALAPPAVALAQTPAPPAAPERSLRTFFKDLGEDFKQMQSDPAGLSIAAAGILSTSLHPLDDDIAEWTQHQGFESGTWIGNGAVLAAGSLALYGLAHWTASPPSSGCHE